MASQKIDKTSKIDALEDLAKAIAEVFQKYTKVTREKAWKSLQSAKGKKEIDKLLNNPKYSTKGVRNLWTEQQNFVDWLRK